eukprot:XP_022263677.1 collagen alpha-1(II) chain-like [Canis lupus familiaris]
MPSLGTSRRQADGGRGTGGGGSEAGEELGPPTRPGRGQGYSEDPAQASPACGLPGHQGKREEGPARGGVGGGEGDKPRRGALSRRKRRAGTCGPPGTRGLRVRGSGAPQEGGSRGRPAGGARGPDSAPRALRVGRRPPSPGPSPEPERDWWRRLSLGGAGPLAPPLAPPPSPPPPPPPPPSFQQRGPDGRTDGRTDGRGPAPGDGQRRARGPGLWQSFPARLSGRAAAGHP